MLMRQGIVCAALNFVLLGAQPSASLAKPPDLPLDPRVVCPEGQEPSPVPNDGPIVGKKSEQPEPAAETRAQTSFSFGLSYEPIEGAVLRFWQTSETGEKVLEFSLPLTRSPARNLLSWAVSGYWERCAEIFSASPPTLGGLEVPTAPAQIRPANFEPNEFEDPAAVLRRINNLDLLDQEYLEMLRSTEPLDLPPVTPAEEVRDVLPAQRNCPRTAWRP